MAEKKVCTICLREGHHASSCPQDKRRSSARDHGPSRMAYGQRRELEPRAALSEPTLDAGSPLAL